MGLSVPLSPGVSGWLPLSPGSVLSQKQTEAVEAQISGWGGQELLCGLGPPQPLSEPDFLPVLPEGYTQLQLFGFLVGLLYPLSCLSGRVP